jgi:hypothetical protein
MGGGLMEKHGKKPKRKSQPEGDLIEAGMNYAEALKASVEFPSPENTQKVLEMGRNVMLKAAGLMSQETLAKLGEIQRQRMMKEE